MITLLFIGVIGFALAALMGVTSLLRRHYLEALLRARLEGFRDGQAYEMRAWQHMARETRHKAGIVDHVN